MIAFNRWHVALAATIILFISLAHIAHKADYDDAVVGYVSTKASEVDEKFHVISKAQALMPQHTVMHTVMHTVERTLTVTTTTTAPAVTETVEVEVEKEAEECPDHRAISADPFEHMNTTISLPDKPVVWDPKGPKGSQIAILTATDGKGHNTEIDNIVELAMQNRDEYAKHHGYIHHFINITKYDLNDVAPVWKKLPAIVETFNKFPDVQWVFWLDLDAIIMEPEVSLQELILSKAGQEKSFWLGGELFTVSNDNYKTYMSREPDFEDIDFIVAQDHNGLNAGTFFLRRSEFTQFLLDIWADPLLMYASFIGKEQDALVHLLKHHPTVRQHTGIARQRTINAFPEGPYWMRWQKGDFLVHLAGCWVPGLCQERWDEFWAVKGTVGAAAMGGPLDGLPIETASTGTVGAAAMGGPLGDGLPIEIASTDP